MSKQNAIHRFDIRNIDIQKNLHDLLGFKTKISREFDEGNIYYANNNINRIKSFYQLTNYIDAIYASMLELSIFEFALVKVHADKVNKEFIPPIYFDKLNDICSNINPNNPRIKNKTLKKSIIEGHLDPYYVAFLSAEQIHPAAWKKILDKNAIKEKENNSYKVTDIYECQHCGSRKSITSQVQTRSSDEPMTIFVTCIVCYNTYTFSK
jgi:DNA-directed RNA polymerase subunit M/transcription elongation factor TFIIS